MYSRTSSFALLTLVAIATIVSGCSSPAATPQPSRAATVTPVPTATPVTVTPSGPPGQPYPAQASVQIKNFAFDPKEVHVAKGGLVTWTNLDGVTHTISFNGVQSHGIGNGDTFSKTFNDTGTFDYICGIHTYMAGKVVVG